MYVGHESLQLLFNDELQSDTLEGKKVFYASAPQALASEAAAVR